MSLMNRTLFRNNRVFVLYNNVEVKVDCGPHFELRNKTDIITLLATTFYIIDNNITPSGYVVGPLIKTDNPNYYGYKYFLEAEEFILTNI
jgi:hypothetical protein